MNFVLPQSIEVKKSIQIETLMEVLQLVSLQEIA